MQRNNVPSSISIEIFYTAHVSARDFNGLAEKLRDADIFIPDALGWSDAFLARLQTIASGVLSPHELMEEYHLSENNYDQYYALLGWLRALYKSYVTVMMADMPNGHPVAKGFYHLFNIGLSNMKKSEKYKRFRHHLITHAKMQKFREEYIIRNVRALIQRLEDEHAGAHYSVVMMFGALHSHLYHALKKESATVTRVYTAMPYVFDYLQEARRRVMLGKEVGHQLVARAIAQFYLEAFILTDEDYCLCGVETSEFHRSVIAALSDRQIEKVISPRSVPQGTKILLKTLNR